MLFNKEVQKFSTDNWATTFVPTMYEAVLTSNAEMVEKPVVDVEAVNSDCSANNCTDSSSSDDSTSSRFDYLRCEYFLVSLC